MSQPSSFDIELLSAYLDGQLSQADSARLESRIQSDPQLHSVYDDLRLARSVLRKLPQRRAPRNFTLTAKMAGVKPPLPPAFPVFRFASALAAILLFFGYAANLSLPVFGLFQFGAAATHAPAEPYAAGMAPAATEAPQEAASEAPPAAPETLPNAAAPTQAVQDNIAPTPSPEPMTVLVAPTETEVQPGIQQKSIPYTSPQPEPPSWPVPPVWLFGLLVLTIISAGTTFLMRRKAEQDWRKARTFWPPETATKDILLLGLALLVIILLAAGIYWMSTL
jgi:hypothetical protein